MQTYLRILSYARPFGRFVPTYIFYTLFSIIFGLINFTLLKPLFDVIFEQVNPESLEKFRTLPSFTFSVEYFTALFNHYFLSVQDEYGKMGTLVFVCIIIVFSVFLSNLFTQAGGAPEHLVKQDAAVHAAQKDQIANLWHVHTRGQQVHSHGNVRVALILVTADELQRLVRASCDLHDGIILHTAILLCKRLFEQIHNKIGMRVVRTKDQRLLA